LREEFAPEGLGEPETLLLDRIYADYACLCSSPRSSGAVRA
jgi:hypothetical protein